MRQLRRFCCLSISQHPRSNSSSSLRNFSDFHDLTLELCVKPNRSFGAFGGTRGTRIDTTRDCRKCFDLEGFIVIFLEPWVAAESSNWLEAQLKSELSKNHVLQNLEWTVIARRYDQDDILLQIKDESRVAEIHLTWETNQIFVHNFRVLFSTRVLKNG
jgi:hypothetical protein